MKQTVFADSDIVVIDGIITTYSIAKELIKVNSEIRLASEREKAIYYSR